MPSIKQVSASLSVVSAPATVGADEPVDVAIRVLDTTGAPVRGLPAAQVVLTSSGANNTLTQPSGVTDANGDIAGATYEGSTAGARTLTVTVASLALDDQPVVTIGGGISGTPNAPGGNTAIVDQPFNELLFTDSGVTWLNGAGYPTPIEGSVAILSDASAPESPSNSLRWTYPIGFDSDNAPGYRECVFGEDYSSLYTCIWLRPSETWEDHVSGVNKLFYWTARNTSEATGTSFLSMFFNATPAPTAFRFVTQNPGDDQVIYTTSGFTPLLGEWHRIEVLQERTSGITGRVRIWCANETNPSAVLALDEAGVVLTDAGETNVAWAGIVANPYWGGNAGIATQEFTLDFDHLVITGVPE